MRHNPYPLLAMNTQQAMIDYGGIKVNKSLIWIGIILLIVILAAAYFSMYQTDICFMDYNNPDTPKDDLPFCLEDFHIIRR